MATTAVSTPVLPHMESVERISKLPVVEQTFDLATNLYSKVKEVNPFVNTVLSTAETTVKGAVDKTLPMANMIERPIKIVDSLLCSSLDFVETNLPVVKLQPDEMYKSTKEYVFGLPGVKCACQYGEQGVRKAVECACAVSEYSTQKLHGLKDSLAAAEANKKNSDVRTLISMYLYTLLHVLTVLSAWVGIGQGEKLERETGNSKKPTGQVNGNANNAQNQNQNHEVDDEDDSVDQNDN